MTKDKVNKICSVVSNNYDFITFVAKKMLILGLELLFMIGLATKGIFGA